MSFNEDTRVKIPSILHLCRMGYTYISLKGRIYDENTNIFKDIFSESILKINKDLKAEGVKKVFDDILLCLDNDDLGQVFYQKLTEKSGVRLIDFENFDNNTFHVVTELTFRNGEDEFRPDITLLINGMPLVFIEVKKPNNKDGVLAERDRMNVRFQNKKFKRFINLFQLLVFSNNMEYSGDDVMPIQGAFYATTARDKASFNYFREEKNLDLGVILKENEEDIENFILKDNNLQVIKNSPEFLTNKSPDTPTHRLLTSLFSRQRLAFLLQYGIAYVQTPHGVEKHIMRYPQLFATKAIENHFEKGLKKGIIWHTQGSGKTALSFYNVAYLTDYFQAKGIVPKFYFIVDRIDLAIQAKGEFVSRGLVAHIVNSREELLRDFKKSQAIHNFSGAKEITVVNIHKFKEDTTSFKNTDYNINVQRIYFLDEVHRSYSPKGSFLANLTNSDTNAILIGLTGTPLIGDDRKSRDTFGGYIHKYYYNASIADGYTLKLIREGIETKYRAQLNDAIKDIKLLQKDIKKEDVLAHHKFAEPMIDYIVKDLKDSRIKFGDDSIGAMIVCDSPKQAKMLFEIFQQKYTSQIIPLPNVEQPYTIAAESPLSYRSKALSASLVLYDVGTKEERKAEIEDFKAGKIDFLIVYSMLLTGFDAKRLKKLYVGRVVQKHNLLQTLTRVNRPYKDFQYGFVVDFADISKEFEMTNKAYFDELQSELGNEIETYSNLFKSREEIEQEIAEIQERLFAFDLLNAEIFSQQISEIQDRKLVLDIKKALANAKDLYNIIRLTGNFELLEKIDFQKLNQLYNETARHLDLLNLRENLQNDSENTQLLNVALENMVFLFRKVSEKEMILADQLKDELRKTRESFTANFDPTDPKYISLLEELKRIFKKNNMNEVTQEEIKENIVTLRAIHEKVRELNRKNNQLKAKYNNDEKYVRLHKRLMERGSISDKEGEIHAVLMKIKENADSDIMHNHKMLENESYFENTMLRQVIATFKEKKINFDLETAKFVNYLVTKEYLMEFRRA